MIKLTAKSFRTHKDAESPDDCQDACAQNDGKGRYAVADGATRTFFPKEWANLLVEHFYENPDLFLAEINWRDWLGPIRQEWDKEVKKKVNEQSPWYIKNPFNTREPAVSTFVGIQFNTDCGEWKAMIVGDSCLFHQSNTGFKSYLIENSADFTNSPEVFASYAKDNHSEPTFKSGSANPGDTFILATDALAKWILEHKENGELDAALDRLKAIETDEQFEFDQFVHEARHDKATSLVNDDVTLMLISVEDDEEPNQQDPLSRGLFLGILTGIFGVFVGVVILLWILRNKK